MNKYMVPVGLSNRHIHLSKEHIDILFGDNFELTEMKALSQPGQFAANEKVEVVGPKSSMVMRVLGPSRGTTQVEISVTDCFSLGVKPAVRDSGDLLDTPGAKIVGPKGEVVIDHGMIVAGRHIHMHLDDALECGVKDKDIVRVATSGKRAVIFENVLVRVNKDFSLEMHLDTDEGNGALLANGEKVELIKYENI